MTTTPLPPIPANTPHITRRIRLCESEVPAQVVLEHAMQAYAAQARADLEAEVQRLRALLADAADDIESWGAYTSDYFQNKHNLAGCVAKYRAALKDTK